MAFCVRKQDVMICCPRLVLRFQAIDVHHVEASNTCVYVGVVKFGVNIRENVDR